MNPRSRIDYITVLILILVPFTDRLPLSSLFWHLHSFVPWLSVPSSLLGTSTTSVVVTTVLISTPTSIIRFCIFEGTSLLYYPSTTTVCATPHPSPYRTTVFEVSSILLPTFWHFLNKPSPLLLVLFLGEISSPGHQTQ